MSDAKRCLSAPSHVPIFVLGLERSGTTWLANVLSAHPEVAAVEAEDHFGVHESIFFSHFAQTYGDLRNDENFERFASDFTASDYYILSGLDPMWLRRRRPRTYAEAMRSLMDEMACRRSGTRYWLEKSPAHTLLAEQLRTDFPDARFICITRRAVDNINSGLCMMGRPPPPYPRRLMVLLRLSWLWSLYNRFLNRFGGSDPGALQTTYERFSADPVGETRRICDFLDMEFVPAMLEPRYVRNTSFRSETDRGKSQSHFGQLILIQCVTTLLRLVPLELIQRLQFARQRRMGIRWPAWCWRRRDESGSLPGNPNDGRLRNVDAAEPR